MKTEDLLNVWYNGLPFSVLETIHGIDLIGLNEIDTETNLEDCHNEWEEFSKHEKGNFFLQHYNDNIQFTGEFEGLEEKCENNYLCCNCGDMFLREDMDFDVNDEDFCKNCNTISYNDVYKD